MLDFRNSQEIDDVIAAIHKFIEKDILPLKIEYAEYLENPRLYYSEDGLLSPQIQEAYLKVRQASSVAGFYNMFGDPTLGGNGDSFGEVAIALIHESITKTYGYDPLVSEIFPTGLFTGGLTPVLLGLQEEVLQEILPKIQSGETILCFALSEPNAGSDVRNISTKAVKDGDHWVINGTKQWISNSPYAHYAMTFAITDQDLYDKKQGGISCFLVEIDGKTCLNSSVIPTLGNLGGEIGIITYENARVHERNLIGELHNGFGKALEGVDVGRIVMASNCVGVAQWALDMALDYSNERVTFGQTIGQHQTIQVMLADSAMEIYAARNMLLNCAWKMENDSRLPIKEISMVKAYCTEMAQRVIDRVMQIHGGMGITNELGLEKAWSWARAMRIPDGTTEIQKVTIAKQLLKGNRSFS